MARRKQKAGDRVVGVGCEACGDGARGEGVGPGARAAGVDAALKEANLRQLRRIEGQVRGIAAMVEGDRYCADIVTQVAAARESLSVVARNLVRNHLRHCAAGVMARDGAGREEMIEELLGMFGRLAR